MEESSDKIVILKPCFDRPVTPHPPIVLSRDKDRYLIGRNPNVVHIHLICPHKSISRVHAVLERTDPGRVTQAAHAHVGWSIKDNGSTNGTHINGNPIPKQQLVALHDGDKVIFGKPKIFREDGTSYTAQTWRVQCVDLKNHAILSEALIRCHVALDELSAFKKAQEKALRRTEKKNKTSTSSSQPTNIRSELKPFQPEHTEISRPFLPAQQRSAFLSTFPDPHPSLNLPSAPRRASESTGTIVGNHDGRVAMSIARSDGSDDLNQGPPTESSNSSDTSDVIRGFCRVCGLPLFLSSDTNDASSSLAGTDRGPPSSFHHVASVPTRPVHPHHACVFCGAPLSGTAPLSSRALISRRSHHHRGPAASQHGIRNNDIRAPLRVPYRPVASLGPLANRRYRASGIAPRPRAHRQVNDSAQGASDPAGRRNGATSRRKSGSAAGIFSSTPDRAVLHVPFNRFERMTLRKEVKRLLADKGLTTSALAKNGPHDPRGSGARPASRPAPWLPQADSHIILPRPRLHFTHPPGPRGLASVGAAGLGVYHPSMRQMPTDDRDVRSDPMEVDQTGAPQEGTLSQPPAALALGVEGSFRSAQPAPAPPTTWDTLTAQETRDLFSAVASKYLPGRSGLACQHAWMDMVIWEQARRRLRRYEHVEHRDARPVHPSMTSSKSPTGKTEMAKRRKRRSSSNGPGSSDEHSDNVKSEPRHRPFESSTPPDQRVQSDVMRNPAVSSRSLQGGNKRDDGDHGDCHGSSSGGSADTNKTADQEQATSGSGVVVISITDSGSSSSEEESDDDIGPWQSDVLPNLHSLTADQCRALTHFFDICAAGDGQPAQITPLFTTTATPTQTSFSSVDQVSQSSAIPHLPISYGGFSHDVARQGAQAAGSYTGKGKQREPAMVSTRTPGITGPRSRKLAGSQSLPVSQGSFGVGGGSEEDVSFAGYRTSVTAAMPSAAVTAIRTHLPSRRVFKPVGATGGAGHSVGHQALPVMRRGLPNAPALMNRQWTTGHSWASQRLERECTAGSHARFRFAGLCNCPTDQVWTVEFDPSGESYRMAVSCQNPPNDMLVLNPGPYEDAPSHPQSAVGEREHAIGATWTALNNHHDATVADLHFTTDGRRLVSAGYDGCINIADAATGRPLGQLVTAPAPHVSTPESLEPKPYSYHRLVLNPHLPNVVAASSEDGAVRLFDIDRQRLLVNLPRVKSHASMGLASESLRADYLTFGKGISRFHLFSGYKQGHVAIWDLHHGQPIGSSCSLLYRHISRIDANMGRHVAVEAVDCAPDGREFLSASEEDVQTFDVLRMPMSRPSTYVSLVEIARSKRLPMRNTNVSWAEYSPCGRYFQVSSEESQVFIFDRRRLDSSHCDPVAVLPQGPRFPDGEGVHGQWMHSLSKPTLVTGCEDQVVRLWDIETACSPHSLQHSPQPVPFCMLSGSGQGTDMGHSNAIKCVAVSPDDSLICSGGVDHRVVLWSAEGPPLALCEDRAVDDGSEPQAGVHEQQSWLTLSDTGPGLANESEPPESSSHETGAEGTMWYVHRSPRFLKEHPLEPNEINIWDLHIDGDNGGEAQGMLHSPESPPVDLIEIDGEHPVPSPPPPHMTRSARAAQLGVAMTIVDDDEDEEGDEEKDRGTGVQGNPDPSGSGPAEMASSDKVAASETDTTVNSPSEAPPDAIPPPISPAPAPPQSLSPSTPSPAPAPAPRADTDTATRSSPSPSPSTSTSSPSPSHGSPETKDASKGGPPTRSPSPAGSSPVSPAVAEPDATESRGRGDSDERPAQLPLSPGAPPSETNEGHTPARTFEGQDPIQPKGEIGSSGPHPSHHSDVDSTGANAMDVAPSPPPDTDHTEMSESVDDPGLDLSKLSEKQQIALATSISLQTEKEVVAAEVFEGEEEAIAQSRLDFAAQAREGDADGQGSSSTRHVSPQHGTTGRVSVPTAPAALAPASTDAPTRATTDTGTPLDTDESPWTRTRTRRSVKRRRISSKAPALNAHGASTDPIVLSASSSESEPEPEAGDEGASAGSEVTPSKEAGKDKGKAKQPAVYLDVEDDGEESDSGSDLVVVETKSTPVTTGAAVASRTRRGESSTQSTQSGSRPRSQPSPSSSLTSMGSPPGRRGTRQGVRRTRRGTPRH